MTGRITKISKNMNESLFPDEDLKTCLRGISQRELVSILREREERRYWPAGDVDSAAFRARFPDRKKLLKMAGLASRRRIVFWHPWHMELTHTAYRLPRQIDWFIPPNGDHEWIDSLVRFTHMLDLAAAHRITGKTRYLQAFEHYLASFSKSRRLAGRHWEYPLNAAIRVTNLIRAYDLLSRAPDLSGPTHLAVVANLASDIRFMSASLDKARGNGAFFMTTALLTAAEYLGDILDTSGWYDRATTRLFEILDSEVQADGIEVEQVPMYHGQVMLVLLEYLAVLQANDRPVSEKLRSTVDIMLTALCRLVDPQGYIPPIGDSDRFTLSYLTNFYSAVTGDTAGCAKLPGGAADQASRKASGCHLTTLNDAGWNIVRWDYSRDRQGYLFFDCSGRPADGKNYHSHADDLQFLLHTSDGPVFTDPGRFTYCREFKAYFPFTRKRIYPEGRLRRVYSRLFPGFMRLASRDWRKHFQHTLSHNTVSVDGKIQPHYGAGPDARYPLVYQGPLSCGRLVLMRGEFYTRDMHKADQEGKRSGDYRHQRFVVGYLPDMWVIVDRLESDEARDWTSSYHLGARCRAQPADGGLRISDGNHMHMMRFIANGHAAPSVAIEDDWVSPVYNRLQRSKTVRARIPGVPAVLIATVMLTHADNRTRFLEAASVMLTSALDGTQHPVFSIGVATGNTTTRLLINPDGTSLHHDGFESDAIATVVASSGSNLLEAGFVGGTFLNGPGVDLHSGKGESGQFHML